MISKRKRIDELLNLNSNINMSGGSNKFYHGMAHRVKLANDIAFVDESDETVEVYLERKNKELLDTIESMSEQKTYETISLIFKKANERLNSLDCSYRFDSEDAPYNGTITRSIILMIILNKYK